jgi:P-type Ca2+ transporter type 2C
MAFNLSDFYSISVDDSLKKFGSSFKGLDDKAVEANLKTYGPNEIPEKKQKNIFKKILEAIMEPMVLILIAATIFSIVIKDYIEGLAILGVVIINTIIGLVQDGKAEKAVEELKKILSPQFKVLRNGSFEIVATRFIVPGDVIVFEAGDIIPADARIVEGKNILTDEAHLTGESEPVSKNTDILKGIDLKPYEMKNIVFSGSKILNGFGKALVLKTGIESEMGKIAENIQDQKEEETPLQIRLNKEIKFLVGLAFFSAAFVLGVSILKHFQVTEAILIAVSIMIAVFPEGLPASITIALSLAVERLAKQSVIVKKMSSIETLGNVDFICTDKTGTITQHNMSVKEIFLGDMFYTSADLFKLIAEGESHIVHDIFLISNKCSTAMIEEVDGNIIKESGDPTEIALLKAGVLTGFKPDQFQEFKILDDIPFSSENMYAASLVQLPDAKKKILIKGAPDRIIEMCSTFYNNKTTKLDEGEKHKIIKELGTRSEKGFRLIGFMEKDVPENVKKLENATLDDFMFIGCAAIYDPPKDEVKNVIKIANEANINVVMITGDSKKTGFHIAESVGIATDINQAIEGHDLEKMDEKDFSEQVENLRVYSRVVPLDKLRIVEKLKEKEHTVAMTGDGVNDAPALKRSDVGIAMGRAGTQVSQEAAKIILTDDNFSTIITAIKEGRTVFQNLKKLVKYLITNNIGKVVTILLSPVFGPGASLSAIQILWTNVIMETAPGIGLSIDPATDEIMRNKPAKITEPILFWKDRFHMILDGIIFGVCITLGFLIAYKFTNDKTMAQTVAFLITLISPQIYVFILREGKFIKKFKAPNKLLKFFSLFMAIMILCIVYIPVLNVIFNTEPIFDWKVWIMILVLSIFTSFFRLIAGLFLKGKKK